MAVFIDNVNDGSATTSVWILQQIVEHVWFWIVGPSAWIKIKSQDRCDAWNGLSDLLQSRTALGEKETVHLGNDGRQDRTQPGREIEGYVFQLGRCQASGFGGPWRVCGDCHSVRVKKTCKQLHYGRMDIEDDLEEEPRFTDGLLSLNQKSCLQWLTCLISKMCLRVVPKWAFCNIHSWKMLMCYLWVYNLIYWDLLGINYDHPRYE